MHLWFVSFAGNTYRGGRETGTELAGRYVYGTMTVIMHIHTHTHIKHKITHYARPGSGFRSRGQGGMDGEAQGGVNQKLDASMT